MELLIGTADQLRTQTFYNEFASQLPAIMNHVFDVRGIPTTFKKIIDASIKKISEAKTVTEHIAEQKNLVKQLVEVLESAPSKNWNISAAQVAHDGATNCSSSAAILQMILESLRAETGIYRIDYANPKGHAFNMVTFLDGSIGYVDGRNGIFDIVTKEISTEITPNLTIYKQRKPTPERPFRFIPAMRDAHKGIVTAYLGNLLEVPDTANGIFDAELQNGTTEQERQEMQKEAAPLLKHPAIAPDQIAHTRKNHEAFYSPMKSFYSDPAVQKEIARWESTNTLGEELKKIGALLEQYPNLRVDLRARKTEFRAFLLNEQTQFSTENVELAELIHAYRAKYDRAMILMHRPKSKRTEEIDALLSRL